MRVLISGAFGDASASNPLFAAIAQAMSELGHEVHRYHAAFADRPAAWQKAVERLVTVPVRLAGFSKDVAKPYFPWSSIAQQEQGLLRAVEAHRPDVLIVMTFVKYRASVLQRCRDLGVKRLIGWFLEGPTHHFGVEDEHRLYDQYFCIHRHFDPALRSQIEWLPAVCLNQRAYHRIEGAVRAPRLVFVGARSPRRAEFLRALKGLPLSIWGPGGWPSDPDLAGAFQGEAIWGEQLNKLYNESAIVLNVSTWDPEMGGLTQRVIDVPATGAFLLTDDCSDLRQIFQAGQELAVFGSPAELRERCLYYLDHPTERERVAQAGHQRALRCATSMDLARRLLSGCP